MKLKFFFLAANPETPDVSYLLSSTGKQIICGGENEAKHQVIQLVLKSHHIHLL